MGIRQRRPTALPVLGNMAASAYECLTDRVERRRLDASGLLDPAHRAALGQFFTPVAAARLIASMLTGFDGSKARLLDPGAGVGSLTAAAVERLAALGVRELEIVAWEIDERLRPALAETLDDCAAWANARGLTLRWDVRNGDYIVATAAALAGELGTELERFDAVIMNPPYRKVNGGTPQRRALERAGLPITNLYTAFLALAAAQLKPGGVLAAITPRSFTNGRYHAPFRRFFFDRVGIERIHLFGSRAHVFADADVLQENVIFSARRSAKPQTVRLSTSHGVDDVPCTRDVPAREIIHPHDPNRFLRIPSEEVDTEVAEAMVELPASLADLGIEVSTGRVVEFRARDHLRLTPEPGAAPLVRPNHLRNGAVWWPAENGQQKPNALVIDSASEKLLLPNGTYVLVKRLTAKEEPRRVCAAVSVPTVVPGRWIAFENHLNVFHRGNRGLADDLAQGLAAYLNSSFVDRYVRQFNGHTQVNATDLRHLRYPSETQLRALGGAIPSNRPIPQEEVDGVVGVVLRKPASALRDAA